MWLVAIAKKAYTALDGVNDWIRFCHNCTYLVTILHFSTSIDFQKNSKSWAFLVSNLAVIFSCFICFCYLSVFLGRSNGILQPPTDLTVNEGKRKRKFYDSKILSRSLSLSLSYTHTHTISLSLPHTHTHTFSLSLHHSLSHTHTHTQTHTLSHILFFLFILPIQKVSWNNWHN